MAVGQEARQDQAMIPAVPVMEGERAGKGERLQFRQEKIGFIYQDYSLFPEYTAYEEKCSLHFSELHQTPYK